MSKNQNELLNPKATTNEEIYSNATALSNDLGSISEEMATAMFNQTKELMGTVVGYKELMMMYTCAIKEVRTKFDVLNTEFNVRYQRNPISYMTTRLKRTSSIVEKLARKDKSFTIENIEQNLNDIAGIRVVCSYIDDIYTIAEALIKQDDITLLARKDYIAKPKPNGYRSLHLIVEVPVFFAEVTKPMKVEVQIRTMAMDFWASLEHQLKYKHEIPEQDYIVSRLSKCAEDIANTDAMMLDIRQQIENLSDAPTEDDILIEKLSRLDFNME
jgi:putative GTP pyrophosphokinase